MTEQVFATYFARNICFPKSEWSATVGQQKIFQEAKIIIKYLTIKWKLLVKTAEGILKQNLDTLLAFFVTSQINRFINYRRVPLKVFTKYFVDILCENLSITYQSVSFNILLISVSFFFSIEIVFTRFSEKDRHQLPR